MTDYESVIFVQAEDGIRALVRARGLGDVYKRQLQDDELQLLGGLEQLGERPVAEVALVEACLIYTSDAADDLLCVELGGRPILKQQTQTYSASTSPPISFVL